MVHRTFAFLALVASPLAAQDGPPELLGGVAGGYSAALEQEQRFGVYFNDGVVGEGTFTVERAPEGSGATYRVTTTMKTTLADVVRESSSVALLDERLAIVERRSEESTSDRKRQRRWYRDDQSWVKETTIDGNVSTVRCVSKLSADYGEPHLVWLLIQHAGTPRPGTYRLPAIRWPDKGEPAEAHVEVTVGEIATHEHRGRTVQARKLRIVDPDGVAAVCMTDEAGRFGGPLSRPARTGYGRDPSNGLVEHLADSLGRAGRIEQLAR